MQKSESIFWGLVGISAAYIVLNVATSPHVSAQTAQQVSAQAIAAQPVAQGMGCMAKGGGCGCGGMKMKQ